MDREGGNKESRSLSISPFSLHFLFIFSFSLNFLTARLAGWHNLCSPAGTPNLYNVINGRPLLKAIGGGGGGEQELEGGVHLLEVNFNGFTS